MKDSYLDTLFGVCLTLLLLCRVHTSHPSFHAVSDAYYALLSARSFLKDDPHGASR